MRENLIGYLLNALEPSEQALVEAHLSRDPQLKHELDLLSRSLQPLAADRAEHVPPVGLATRTCEFINVQTKVTLPPPVTSVPARWSMADLAVAAGVFLAATLLFWPAMNQSRFAARVRSCQNNLRQLGVSLSTYSQHYPGQFPTIDVNHKLSRSGIYAVILREQGLLPEARLVICPASDLAERKDDFNVPTFDQLMRAQAEKLNALRKQMGGSYSYSLGFYQDGRYQPPKDRRRATHALMADAPNHQAPDRFSSNHGGCGLNVLFEDLHVGYITTCRTRGCGDHIFENRLGKPHAGVDRDDVVLGSSDATPVLVPVASDAP